MCVCESVCINIKKNEEDYWDIQLNVFTNKSKFPLKNVILKMDFKSKLDSFFYFFIHKANFCDTFIIVWKNCDVLAKIKSIFWTLCKATKWHISIFLLITLNYFSDETKIEMWLEEEVKSFMVTHFFAALFVTVHRKNPQLYFALAAETSKIV